MQSPKKKTSKSRRNMRRAHDGLVAVRISECPKCGEQVRSHCVCLSCGTYRGRQVLPELAKDSASV